MLDPWSSVHIEDYRETMREFGIDLFDVSRLPEDPEPPRLFKRNIVFGQRGFDAVLERMRSGKQFSVMSGLMPSGRMHLGHKMVIDQMMYFQRFDAMIFVGVADFEAYATRGVSLEKARKMAIESYIKNYLALGLGREGLEIYFQSMRSQVKDLGLLLGRKVNLSVMRSIYGFDEQTNMAHMNSPLVQAGDMLHPQLRLGPHPVVVPVGIDQDPHMRLCRDLASDFRIYSIKETPGGTVGVFVKVDDDVESLLSDARSRLEKAGYLEFKMVASYKALYVYGATVDDIGMIDQELASLEFDMGNYGFIPPASTYHRFIRGLTGEKMSSSRPETAIFLDDDPDDADKKLRQAITGGRETAEEHRRLGGRPEICSVFETMLYHTVDDEEEIKRVERECRNGERLCGGCKKEAIEHMRKFLSDLSERRKETEHLIDNYVKYD
jgi:tryptophanyl-tRNA synthetase